MSHGFNYRHLYYFWVVAKEGGMARAATRLGLSVQTVSSQVGELERALGHSLLKPAGRGLALTEAGHAALQQADAIFQLGQALPAHVQDAAGDSAMRLQVGVSEGVSKLVVRRMMQPVMLEPLLRLRCVEGSFQGLLADLALHRLDLVLADRAPPASAQPRLYSRLLESSALAWYAAPSLLAAARRGFPRSLAEVPVLLPTAACATRERLDRWFENQGLRPALVGEFEDSALLKTFGAYGMGVFPAPSLVHEELLARYRVRRVGPCDGVEEHYYAIASDRKLQHPLVQRVLQADAVPPPDNPGHAPPT